MFEYWTTLAALLTHRPSQRYHKEIPQRDTTKRSHKEIPQRDTAKRCVPRAGRQIDAPVCSEKHRNHDQTWLSRDHGRVDPQERHAQGEASKEMATGRAGRHTERAKGGERFSKERRRRQMREGATEGMRDRGHDRHTHRERGHDRQRERDRGNSRYSFLFRWPEFIFPPPHHSLKVPYPQGLRTSEWFRVPGSR